MSNVMEKVADAWVREKGELVLGEERAPFDRDTTSQEYLDFLTSRDKLREVLTSPEVVNEDNKEDADELLSVLKDMNALVCSSSGSFEKHSRYERRFNIYSKGKDTLIGGISLNVAKNSHCYALTYFGIGRLKKQLDGWRLQGMFQEEDDLFSELAALWKEDTGAEAQGLEKEPAKFREIRKIVVGR